MRHLRGYLDRASIREGEPLQFVAATEGLKADGLDLRMDNCRLERFIANPVVMYGHRYSGRDNLPIGKSVETKTDGDKLRAAISFDPTDVFAVQVDSKYRNGYLNAVSIGFDFGSVDPLGVPDWWELLEISAVPIPLDPDALLEDGRDEVLVLSRAIAGLRDGTLTDSLAEALNVAKERADQAPPEDVPTPSLNIRERRLRMLDA